VNILVAVDLSDCTDIVIKKASALAKSLSAKVWLLHVAEPEPEFVGYDVGPQTERDAVAQHFRDEHRALQALATGMRTEALETTALLVRGMTVETIVAEASKLDADMIIVGSHGRGAMQRLLVGSISEGVIRHAERPVLIIPTHKRGQPVSMADPEA